MAGHIFGGNASTNLFLQQQHHQQPASVAAFNAMQQVNKEQSATIKDLGRVVANLTRENNSLQARIASLLDSGLTPGLASYDAYRTSHEGVVRIVEASIQSRGGGGGADEYGGGRYSSSAATASSSADKEQFSENRFLKTRIKRLEAALALEMRARDQLELKCTAQQTALAQVLAKVQQQQDEQARMHMYGGGHSGYQQQQQSRRY